MTSRPEGGGAPASAPFLVAIAAAALGAGAATALLLRPERATAPATSPLEAELVRLTARVDDLARAAATAVPIAPATGDMPRQPAVDAALAQQLEQQLQQLAERVRQLEARQAQRGAAEAAQPERTPSAPVDRAVAIAEMRRTVLAPGSTAAVKLEAWSRMRFQDGSWDDATVAEMVRLGLTSEDAAVRADVWRQAHGNQRNDAMVPALL